MQRGFGRKSRIWTPAERLRNRGQEVPSTPASAYSRPQGRIIESDMDRPTGGNGSSLWPYNNHMNLQQHSAFAAPPQIIRENGAAAVVEPGNSSHRNTPINVNSREEAIDHARQLARDMQMQQGFSAYFGNGDNGSRPNLENRNMEQRQRLENTRRLERESLHLQNRQRDIGNISGSSGSVHGSGMFVQPQHQANQSAGQYRSAARQNEHDEHYEGFCRQVDEYARQLAQDLRIDDGNNPSRNQQAFQGEESNGRRAPRTINADYDYPDPSQTRRPHSLNIRQEHAGSGYGGLSMPSTYLGNNYGVANPTHFRQDNSEIFTATRVPRPCLYQSTPQYGNIYYPDQPPISVTYSQDRPQYTQHNCAVHNPHTGPWQTNVAHNNVPMPTPASHGPAHSAPVGSVEAGYANGNGRDLQENTGSSFPLPVFRGNKTHSKSIEIPKYRGRRSAKTPYDFLVQMERYEMATGCGIMHLLNEVVPISIEDEADRKSVV